MNAATTSYFPALPFSAPNAPAHLCANTPTPFLDRLLLPTLGATFRFMHIGLLLRQ